MDALINFLLFNYKLYLNTKRTKQTTEPLEKNAQRKNTSTRRNSWSSASQNNSWHAELAVTEKQKVKHTKPSIKKKSIEHTTMSLYNTPGEFLKVSDPPRSDNYRVPHKNDVPRQTKPEKATAPPAQLESSNAILPTPGNQKSTKTCQACLILSGSMSKICLKTVVGKMMCGRIVCG